MQNYGFPPILSTIRLALYQETGFSPYGCWSIINNSDPQCDLAECFGIESLELSEDAVLVRGMTHRLFTAAENDDKLAEFLDLLPVFYSGSSKTTEDGSIDIRIKTTIHVNLNVSPRETAKKILYLLDAETREHRQLLGRIGRHRYTSPT